MLLGEAPAGCWTSLAGAGSAQIFIFQILFMTLSVMSRNKAGISLCARETGCGALEVLSERVGAEPWQPQGLCPRCPGPWGTSCQRLQWMLLGAQGSRNLGHNRVCFPSPEFSAQLWARVPVSQWGGSPVQMLLLSHDSCWGEPKGPVSSLEPC